MSTSGGSLRDAIGAAFDDVPTRFASILESFDLTRDKINEATLVSAIVSAISARSGAELMLEYRAPVVGWDPKPFGVDIGLVDQRKGERAFIEAKWCNDNKVCEMMWDALKLACIEDLPGATTTRVLAFAASRARHWEKGVDCASYFMESGELVVPTVEFLTREAKAWAYNLSGGAARPVDVPASLVFEPLCVVPLLTDRETFDLRVVTVAGGEGERIRLRNGLVIARSSTVELN